MAETRTVIVCSQCEAFWDPEAEQAACTDSSHDHHRFDSHLHCDRVVLLCGHPSTDAVAWIRATYCERAVETEGQEAFVLGLHR